MERSKWKSEGFMVTASDSSANTVPGERTGLECYLWCTTEKSRSGCQRVEKEEKKEKGTGAERTEKKAVQQKNEPEKEQLRRKKAEKPLQIEEKTRTAAKEQKSTEKQTKPEKSKTAESEAKETELKTSERKQPEKEKVSDKLSRFWNRCKKIVGSILKFPGKLKKKLTNIRLTFRGFCDKIKRWRTLWNEDSTQAALRFLTEKGRKLIRHVLPRKIKGSITFGCEDPALTGQILGAVAIAYPLYGKGVAVYPRFEEKILEGQLQMKGRIVAACLLWQAWKIYRNPDVRKTLKKIR